MSELNVPNDAALPPRAIVAQNLLLARTALDLTQQELANASGISRATIAQLEAGIGDPRLSTLDMLATILHVPAHFLLLDHATFKALAELVAQGDALNRSVQKPREALARIFSAGGGQNRNKAGAMGVDSVREAGLSGNANLVGAAIGSARFHATGAYLGAHLAELLEQFRPATKIAKIKAPDDSEFTLGEGI